MKKLFLLFAFVVFSAHAQIPEAFKRQLEQNGLQFEMPAGYKAVPVIDNGDLQYSFAIVNEAKTMEVRYSIFPMKPLLDEYKKSLDDPNVTMIDPNKLYIGINMSNGLNMTGGNEPEIASLDPKAVKKEFNADWGGSSFFEFKCAFGKGWKYGLAVYLHKIDTADVIVTFMSNDNEKNSDLMESAFHSIRFVR